MINAMNAIANQVIRNSGRSARNAGWPYFHGTFRDYPAFKRKFESFRANYHRGTPTQELFQQFREMCLPEKIAARIKLAETMENAWIRLDAWFGDKSLFIKDLMQDIKNVAPIKDGDNERLMDYYVMLQAHIADARVMVVQGIGVEKVQVFQCREDIKLSEYLMGTTTDRTLVDSGEGTYVWDYSQDACPDTLVSLYRGRIKVLTNSTASFTDATAIVAGGDKNQVAGLELKETMILCGRVAQTTHIKSIAVFFHPMEQIEVASGKFNMVTTEAEFTRLESELSFLQVRSTMTLQETIRQVKAEIWEDRKQIAHTRLESIVGAENPYSLMQVFGRGHQVTRNGATVYVTRCQAAEVLPRTHTNCTNEIPAILNGTNVFVDPISFVIKAAAAPVRCNDVAPPRWRLNGRWYCAFSEIRDCAEPGRIPMKPIAIDDIKVMNLGLGRSIYSPAQLEEFVRFQESQGTRRAFLAESAERAYNSRFGGQWGSGLSDLATESLIDAVGYHLVPMYRVIGPTAAVVLLVLFLVGILRMLLDIVIRAIAIARVRGCGW